MKEKVSIQQIQQGDKNALGEVFDFYYEKILKFIYRRTSSQETAEDITSEVFLGAIENIHNFKWKGEGSFKNWIYRIANNKICDYFRKNYGRETIDIDEVGEIRDDIQKDPQETLILEEDAEEIRKIMVLLSEKDQNIINLVFFEEMDVKEIAGILNCSNSSVYTQLHRALKKLKNLLQNQDRNL